MERRSAMKRCPTCNHENEPSSTFCEICGSALDDTQEEDSDEFRQSTDFFGEEYIPTPPPLKTPAYPYDNPLDSTQYRILAHNPALEPLELVPADLDARNEVRTWRPRSRRLQRTFGSSVFSTALYLWGAFCGTFGLMSIALGIRDALHGESDEIPGITFFASLVVSMALLIIVLIEHRHPRLRWWARLTGSAAATLLGVAALVAGVGPLVPGTPGADFMLGFICVSYGSAIVVLAVW